LARGFLPKGTSAAERKKKNTETGGEGASQRRRGTIGRKERSLKKKDSGECRKRLHHTEGDRHKVNRETSYRSESDRLGAATGRGRRLSPGEMLIVRSAPRQRWVDRKLRHEARRAYDKKEKERVSRKRET